MGEGKWWQGGLIVSAGMAALIDMGVVRLRLGNRQSLALDLEVPAQRGLGINTSLTVPRCY